MVFGLQDLLCEDPTARDLALAEDGDGDVMNHVGKRASRRETEAESEIGMMSQSC